MDGMISRPCVEAGRIFPRITPDLYRSPEEPADVTPDQQAARHLVTLAKEDPIPWQRLTRWKLPPMQQVVRLLSHHRLAMEAEQAAKLPRANFYWREMYSDLRVLEQRRGAWEGVAAALMEVAEVDVLRDPAQLRQRLVTEVLIDTHAAFYNGHVQTGTVRLGSRAFIHFEHIRNLLLLLQLPPDNLDSLLQAPLEKRAQLYEADGRWADAIQDCSDLVRYFPEKRRCIGHLARLYFLWTVKSLDLRRSELQRNVQKIQNGISQLDLLHHSYPQHPTVSRLREDLDDLLGRLRELPIGALLQHPVLDQGATGPTKPAPVPRDPPILVTAPPPRWKGMEPLIPWIFDDQHIRVKLLAAVALFALLLAGGLTLTDGYQYMLRDTAYRQMLQAEQQHNYLDVMDQAAVFLTNKPFTGNDSREQEVKVLYAEALVRWVTAQGDAQDPATLARIERYQTLVHPAK